MKVAISQPTYLPWLGYFDLIDQVDKFVLLDDVQFEKQSWQQRNRIKTPAGFQWLTVPVVFRGRLHQRIKDVEIRDIAFWHDHLRAIELNYRRAPFFEQYFAGIGDCLESGSSNLLATLNRRLIDWFLEKLAVKTPLVWSSDLGQLGRRTELLANICKSLGSTQYISPLGSAGYLLPEQDILAKQGIELVFQQYHHPEYSQQFGGFLPYASVLDLLFNRGPDSLEVIRRGRAAPLLPAEVPLASIQLQS